MKNGGWIVFALLFAAPVSADDPEFDSSGDGWIFPRDSDGQESDGAAVRPKERREFVFAEWIDRTLDAWMDANSYGESVSLHLRMRWELTFKGKHNDDARENYLRGITAIARIFLLADRLEEQRGRHHQPMLRFLRSLGWVARTPRERRMTLLLVWDLQFIARVKNQSDALRDLKLVEDRIRQYSLRDPPVWLFGFRPFSACGALLQEVDMRKYLRPSRIGE